MRNAGGDEQTSGDQLREAGPLCSGEEQEDPEPQRSRGDAASVDLPDAIVFQM